MTQLEKALVYILVGAWCGVALIVIAVAPHLGEGSVAWIMLLNLLLGTYLVPGAIGRLLKR